MPDTSFSSDASAQQTLTLPAPAKLTRMLHIVGRRDDGYHELQTLFQFLDHGDVGALREALANEPRSLLSRRLLGSGTGAIRHREEVLPAVV